MSEKEKNEKPKGISRRKLLKDAGLVVGGATVGSMAILSACKGETTTQTVTSTKTVTVTSPSGISTTTVTSPGGTATVTAPAVTVTSPPVTKVVETPVACLTTLNVNGRKTTMVLKANWSLAYVLREKLALTGTKKACESGDCGVCTVLMDNRPVLSCMVLAVEADNKVISTVEGLAQVGKIDPLQQAFIDCDALQCGFCTPAQLMLAKALLAFKPKPTADEVKEFMAGTLCRCGAYPGILNAVLSVGK
jgi:aerobic-type carbon monoxide dehydrogenase small subunit (CoxS/CutS family)